MQLKSVTQCMLFFCFAILGTMTAAAQTAGSPSEMKPPGDPTANTRPATPAPSTPASNAPAKSTAPEPAPATDPTKSDTPAAATATGSASATDSNAAAPSNVPTTTVYPETDPKSVLAPKLDPGPLPENKSALIGGKVRDIDQIRNEMTVDIFGKGGRMKVLFDPRTRFDRNGTPTNQTTLKKGDLVYLDTQLVNHKIFARDVYLRASQGTADATGQVVGYNAKANTLTINDQMSRSPVTVRLAPATVIHGRDGSTLTAANVSRNALVAIKLSPASTGGAVADQIDIVAQPGSQFTFYGTLTNIDLRRGTLAVENKSDHKSYDIRFEPSEIGATDDLKVGNEVAVNAVFNGRDYTAKSVAVSPSNRAATPE